MNAILSSLHMYETGLQDGVALELSSNIATKLV